MSRSISTIAACLFLSGCAIQTVSDVTVKREIAGGEMATLHFHAGNVVQPETSDFRVEKTIFSVDSKELNGCYVFSFDVKGGELPRRVTVDDVSEDPVTNWVDDDHPAFKAGHWEFRTRRIGFDEKTMRWLHELDASVRVYRFTIEKADGTKVVLDAAGVYPMGVKEFVKTQVDAAARPQPAP